MESFRKYPLERKWVIWEMWNSKDSSTYGKNMQKVGEFNDLWTFWQHWANLPHSDPKFFFVDAAKSEEKIPVGLNSPIESIGVFEDGVLPAWEDKENTAGCDFFCRIQSDGSDMKSIWQKAVFSLIGETFPHAESVTGVRIVDRAKIFKIEVWVRFSNDPQKAEAMRQRLCKEFDLSKPEDVEIAPHQDRYNKITN